MFRTVSRSIRALAFVLVVMRGYLLLAQPLNGTYTVGPTGTYTTLTAAITALQTNGVSGPVFMDIQSGTYAGNWTIFGIAGTSTVNRVTFRSQASDSLAVVLNAAVPTNPVLTLNGCSFVTWSEVTFGGSSYGVRITGTTADCRIANCVVNATGAFGSGIATYLSANDRITLDRNRITANYTGIYFAAVIAQYHDDVVITGNVVSAVTQAGIHVGRADNLTVEGNTVTSNGTNTATYVNGIDLRTPVGVIRAAKNTVNWGIGSWAFYLENAVGDPGVPIVVENNLFAQYGVATSSTVNVIGSDNLRFVHNSVRSGLTQHAVQFQFADLLVVEGNILQTMNEEVVMTQSATFTSIDHNVYHCTQTNVVRWNVSTYYTWTAWRALGWDANSVFADPLFVGPTDLHIQAGSPAIGVGPMPLLVSTDGEGDVRGTASTHLPEAGADERTDACTAGLAGTYLLGPSAAAYFHSFTEAVNTLVSCGISAPVVFRVESGTYAEQVSIGAVAGTSAVNTITFESLALDSTAVTLVHPSATGNVNDYALAFNGVDHITVRKITVQRSGALNYGQCVQVNGGSTHCQVRNCRLLPSASTSGVSYCFAVNVPTSSDVGDLVVADNAVVGGSGVVLGALTGGTVGIAGNTFNSVLVGVSMNATSIATTIDRNTINTRVGAGGTRGLLLNNVSGALVAARNAITGTSTTFYGMVLSSVSGTAATPIRFENNSIIGINSGLGAFNVLAGTCNYLEILHNSISMTGGTTGQGVTMVSGSGIGCRILNNAIRSVGPGLRVEPASRVSAADNNVIYATNTNAIWWGTAWYYDIPSLAAGSGMNGNSLMMDPMFVSNTADLHLQPGSPCAGRGQVIATIIVDQEGEVRPQPALTTPDAGADETIEYCGLLSGTYTIGPVVGNDFLTFSAAIQKMTLCGIGGPVTFLVQSGTYTEQLDLGTIPGNSAANTITFRSQAADSAAVVLTWPSQTATANNWVVRMNGADFVTWDRITIARSGTNANAQGIVFNSASNTAGSQGTRITHCRLQGTTTAGTSELVFAASNGHEDSVVVEHTRFENGTYGVRWTAVADNDLLLLMDNIFTGQSVAGVALNIRDRMFAVRRNHLAPGAGQGVVIGGSRQGFDMHSNRVLATATGVSFTAVYDLGTTPPRFYNNTIVSAGVGVLVTSPVSALHMDNNSISAGSYGVHFAGGANGLASLRNNAIASGNYTVYRQTTTAIPLTTNNALWRTTAGPLAYWTAAQNTLAALQGASGGFAASVAADPRYFNAATGDLHAYAMELDAAGTPIAHVMRDIDGAVRNAVAPDIGADEFQPQLWTDALNTCAAADPITSTGSGLDQWIYKDRKVVARFNDNGQNLGTVQLNVFLHNGPVRTSDLGQHYLDRNWHLVTQNTITSSVGVRLFFSGAEFAPFAAADPLVSVLGDAGVAHYMGTNENCMETDNPAGQTWTGMFPVTSGTEARIASSGGTSFVSVSIGDDGELYVTGQGQVLPVELLSFTGERLNAREVRLDWSTATEHNNAGFEVWRLIEGEADFTEVGWVDGAGDSQQRTDYSHVDANDADRTSYYKLKQVDHDGRSEWTPVVAVAGARRGAELLAYPNPAHGQVMLTGLPAGTTAVTLHDASGRVVRSWGALALLDGLEALQRGVYTVQVLGTDGPRAVRVVLE